MIANDNDADSDNESDEWWCLCQPQSSAPGAGLWAAATGHGAGAGASLGLTGQVTETLSRSDVTSWQRSVTLWALSRELWCAERDNPAVGIHDSCDNVTWHTAEHSRTCQESSKICDKLMSVKDCLFLLSSFYIDPSKHFNRGASITWLLTDIHSTKGDEGDRYLWIVASCYNFRDIVKAIQLQNLEIWISLQ